MSTSESNDNLSTAKFLLLLSICANLGQFHSSRQNIKCRQEATPTGSVPKTICTFLPPPPPPPPIVIRDEWYGIVNGQNPSIFNRVTALVHTGK